MKFSREGWRFVVGLQGSSLKRSGCWHQCWNLFEQATVSRLGALAGTGGRLVQTWVEYLDPSQELLVEQAGWPGPTAGLW